MMKTEVVDGEEITVFDDVEELKWFFHAKLCKGESSAEPLMDQCVKVKDVNEWLKRLRLPYKIKKA